MVHISSHYQGLNPLGQVLGLESMAVSLLKVVVSIGFLQQPRSNCLYIFENILAWDEKETSVPLLSKFKVLLNYMTYFNIIPSPSFNLYLSKRKLNVKCGK